MASVHFEHLESRCNLLIQRFLEPAIVAEQVALRNGMPVPEPNFDDFAAFRLLTHAELEGYFESKALDALTELDTLFKSDQIMTSRFVALIYLYLWREKHQLSWPPTQGNDPQSRQQDKAYMKQLAQGAIGFGRQFVATNNGIKESSIHVLSALMGFFPDELDQILVSELNQYGKKRGDVAHRSWLFDTRTFESADIEKNRLITILNLTSAFYES
jgi:hypothetical protein